MIKIYVFAVGLLSIPITTQGGMLLAIPLGLVFLGGGIFLAVWESRRRELAELRQYAEQIENIYITSRWEGDDSVMSRALHAQKMLQKANNKQQVTVHKLYFGYGENVNETWEEYTERVAAFIRDDRQKRHSGLVKSGQLYEVFWLKQKEQRG